MPTAALLPGIRASTRLLMPLSAITAAPTITPQTDAWLL